MKAIRIYEPGGPEVLKYEEVPDPVAGPGQALVKIQYAGVNYGDTGVRRGTYPGGDQPGVTPGIEGVGLIEAVGDGVTDYKPGQGVAIAGELGCYAEYHVVRAERLIPLPDGIEPRLASAAPPELPNM